MAKLKVTQTRSTIGALDKHIATLKALGLHKIGNSRIHDDNPVIRGMIEKVKHLVTVEEIHE